MKTFDLNKHYTHTLSDNDNLRNIIIEVYPDRTWFNENGTTHAVDSYHECWTGVEWLSINNHQNCYSFKEAVECAKSMKKQFLCDKSKPNIFNLTPAEDTPSLVFCSIDV
jgi:hypothetical protein